MAISSRALIMTTAAVLAAAGGCTVLNIPTTTRQAVDNHVISRTIPLYVKAIDFVQRHYQYRLLVARICPDQAMQVTCVGRLFDWTHANIRATPGDWPLVDDHVLNIVIRGHGRDWQKALVFTTLSTYAGVPAFIHRIRESGRRGDLVLSFVRLDGRWIPFDVEHHVRFADANGRLADVDMLIHDPAVVDRATNGILPNKLRYSDFISSRTLVPFPAPAWLHADLQRPWPRIRYELHRLVSLN